MRVIKSLYESENESLVDAIESVAKKQLRQLLEMPAAPSASVAVAAAPGAAGAAWSEADVGRQLQLALALMPQNHRLLHELAPVYAAASIDVKRVIMKLVEPPARAMGVNSRDLTLFIRTCPKGVHLFCPVLYCSLHPGGPTTYLFNRAKF